MAGKSLLDLVIENPNGLGENPPASAAQPQITLDSAGLPYDANGKRIYYLHGDDNPTLGESLLNIAESPAKMLVGAVTEPVNALQRLAENSVDESGNIAIPNPQNPQNQQDVLTGLLTMYGGNAMNPLAHVPEGALASNAFKAADRLPMDEASRLARAREQGFDTSTTLYHGTGKDFSEFAPGKHANGYRRNIYLTDSPEIADIYANSENYGLKGGGSPAIYPVYAKARKPLDVSDLGPDGSHGWLSDNLAAALGVPHPAPGKYGSLYDEARSQGYDMVRLKDMLDVGGPQTQYIPLEPTNIRSKFAAFNPEDAGKPGLLLSDTGKPSLMGSAIAGAEGNTPIRGYRGSNQARPIDAPRSEYWASTSPEVASGYATSPYGFDAPNVTPANFSFENPMTVDAGGSYWAQIPHNGGTTTTDNLARLAEANGHDGLIVRNVVDEMAGNDLPADSILALKRGTVTSPTTGEVLFSDTGKPSIMGSAVAGAEANQPVRAFHSTDAQFDRFDPAFTDEVGFHFGNKDQAQTRQMVKGGITSFINPWSDWRTIPVNIETQNPAALSRDVQHFTGERVANQLVRDGIAPPSLLDDIAGASPEQQTKYVRDWLVSNGYDSVRYPNDFEGAGAPSYMALGTGNVKHAKTGDVLYAGAPPVVTTSDNQDQPLSLADLALIASNR